MGGALPKNEPLCSTQCGGLILERAGDFSLRHHFQSGFGVHSASFEKDTKYFYSSVAAQTLSSLQ